MTEEEKQLLMKDLCGRLPYKVRCKCVNGLGGGETEKGVLKYVGNCYGVISNYYEDVPLHSGFVNNVFYPIENVKPYLRPMSSMTEEEKDELLSLVCGKGAEFFHVAADGIYSNDDDVQEFGIGWAIHWVNFTNKNIADYTDWLNARHFDYRGLIDKGLAIEAPEGMYETKTE